MSKDQVLGILRHILTLVGGGIVNQGLANEQEVTQAVGALIALTGVVWSVLAKARSVKVAAPLVAAGLVALPFLSGCATTGGTTWLTPARVQALTKLVSYSAAAADLSQNADHRQAFELADQKLRELRAAQVWDTATMLAILKSLPFTELQTPEASIAFAGSVLLIDLVGVGEFDARRQDHLVAFICGASDGISMALAGSGKAATRDIILWQLRAEEKSTRR